MQHPLQALQHFCLVVNEEDGSHKSQTGLDYRRLGLTRHRQTDYENSAFTNFGFKSDRSLVFVHNNRTRDRQPLSGAFTHRLGGEKGIEHAVADFFRDAGTGVLDPDFGPIPILPGTNGDRAFVHALRANHCGDGVRGIDYQVQDDLIKFARQTGYGVVQPRLADMSFEDPELIKQGGRFGVRLRASAPSMHMIRADVFTEVTPIIGTERQCEELVKYLTDQFESDPKRIWQSDIFGKSLHDLVREGIQNKLVGLPENARAKLQETLQRIINEGSGGLICIII